MRNLVNFLCVQEQWICISFCVKHCLVSVHFFCENTSGDLSCPLPVPPIKDTSSRRCLHLAAIRFFLSFSLHTAHGLDSLLE